MEKRSFFRIFNHIKTIRSFEDKISITEIHTERHINVGLITTNNVTKFFSLIADAETAHSEKVQQYEAEPNGPDSGEKNNFCSLMIDKF